MGKNPQTDAAARDGNEQKAFANAVLTVILGLVGTATFELVKVLTGPLITAMPTWLRMVVAASFVLGVIATGFMLVWLGGASETSEHRTRYQRLRAHLADEDAGGLYGLGVTRALAAVDHYLGDRPGTPLGVFPRAFGLKEAAPLWTSSSYERSLMIAVAYPLLAIYAGWVVWGEIGPAEAALRIGEQPDQSKRVLVGLIGIAGILCIIRGYLSTTTRTVLIWLATGAGISCLSWFFNVGGVFIISVAAIATAVCIGSLEDDRPDVDSILTALVDLSFAIAVFSLFGPIPGVIAWLLLTFTSNQVLAGFRRRGWGSQVNLAISLTLFVMILVALPLVSANELTRFGFAGTMFFIGVLAFVNAPFDWLAIGMTRALVRRGRERGGYWPLAYALVDFLTSLVLMALLAIAILWTTEIYNHFLTMGGGTPVIDVGVYLEILADPAKRGDPGLYWLYAMLFSSQIPALINIAFGLVCVLRGVPALNRWMLARLPEGGGIGSWRRLEIAGLSGLQVAIAALLGLAGYYLGVVLLVGSIDPLFGDGLVQMLKSLRLAGFGVFATA